MTQEQKKLFLKSFGTQVKQLRLGKGLTQDEVAVITGFHRNYISDIERGEANPTLISMKILSGALQVELFALIKSISSTELFGK